jgi:ribosomal protein S27AE
MPAIGVPFIIQNLNATCARCGQEVTLAEMQVITTLILKGPKCGYDWRPIARDQ